MAPSAGAAPYPGEPGMPDWMRSLQGASQGNAQAQAPVHMQMQGGGGMPPNGQGPAGMGGEWGGAPGEPQAPQYAEGSLSVGSLLSEDALPDWIRNAGQGPATPAANGGWPPTGGMGQSAQPGWGAAPTPGNGGWGPAGAGPIGAQPGWGQSPLSNAAAPWGQPAQPAPQAGAWGANAQPWTAGNGAGYPAGQPQPGMGGAVGQPGGAVNLFDESALPDWLRAAATGRPYEAPPGMAPGIGLGGAPGGAAGGWPGGQAGSAMHGGAIGAFAPQQPGGLFQPQQAPQTGLDDRMPAQSLLDASALPSWLGGPSENQAPADPARPLGGDGLSAHTLVDERALPMWLRQEPATPAVEGPPAGSISQWLAAPVTDEPLPAWLSQVYSQAQVPRIPVSQPLPAPFATPAPQAAAPMGSMSAGQLLDDTALPDWLRAQAGPSFSPAGGAAYTPSQPAPGNGAFAFGGNGSSAFGATGPGAFGASAGNGSSAFGAPTNNGSGVFGGNGWGGDVGGLGNAAPAMPGMPSAMGAAGANGGAGTSFSASDLIDPSVLPSWVRQDQGMAAEPVFSSTQGWTSKQVSMTPGQNGAGAGGGWGYAGDTGGVAVAQEANLPPWLGGAGAGPMGSGPGMGMPNDTATGLNSRTGRRSAQGTIPETELPPWLRGSGQGASRGDRSGGWPGASAPTWNEQRDYAGARAAMGQGNAEPEPGTGEEFSDFFDGPPAGAGDQPEDLYADRFGDERPGMPGRFSYDYDHAAEYGGGGGDGAGWEENEPRRTGKRKRWFGKK